MALGVAGRKGMKALGYGDPGQRVGEVLGGFLGGAAFGGPGYRGGRAAGNRLLPALTTRAGVLARQGTSGGKPSEVAAANGETDR